MALPTGKQTSDFESIEPGTYEVTFISATLSPETEYQSEAFNDGEGLKYQAINMTYDVDGEEWTERFVKVSLHENAKLYNRLSALYGQKISETDTVEWGVADGAETNLAIDNYYKAKEADPAKNIKKDDLVQIDYSYDGIKGDLESIKINDVELIGRTCLLALDVNSSGYNRAKAGAASALPKRGGGKGRKAASIPEAAEVATDDDVDEPEDDVVETPAAPAARGRSKPQEPAKTTGRSRKAAPSGAPQ